MSTLVKPHGATRRLMPLLLEGTALKEERQRAKALPQITISSREAGDLIMLGIGGFTPLQGFMNQSDWEGVCDEMRLTDGTFWPIPITLSTDKATADGLKIGAEIALAGSEDGGIMATMQITEKYTIDKDHECTAVFKTKDPEHPGVRMVMAQGEVNLAGPVKVLSQGDFPERFKGIYMTPAETRARFEANGWSTVAAFQTRNPMHRSHEYLVKIAIEVCDGVLIHSLLGKLKPGDIPADVRSAAISSLIEHYFVKGHGDPGRLSPWTCATPGRARPCCTPCSARTTAALTSSSAATTPAWASTTARSTPSTSSMRSPWAPWRPKRSKSTGPSGAIAATAWRP